LFSHTSTNNLSSAFLREDREEDEEPEKDEFEFGARKPAFLIEELNCESDESEELSGPPAHLRMTRSKTGNSCVPCIDFANERNSSLH